MTRGPSSKEASAHLLHPPPSQVHFNTARKGRGPSGPGAEMSRVRRSGLRREPPDGCPLDQIFVGVATLRTLRELFTLEGSPGVYGEARSFRLDRDYPLAAPLARLFAAERAMGR